MEYVFVNSNFKKFYDNILDAIEDSKRGFAYFHQGDYSKIVAKPIKKGVVAISVNHNNFACFDYQSDFNDSDNPFELGDVVYDKNNNCIGVVIQLCLPNKYGNYGGELRLDSDGNQPYSDLRYATIEEIKKMRPELLGHNAFVNK